MYKYKIGDIITIKERIGDEWDYPFGFVDNMCIYSNRKAVITHIYFDGMSRGQLNRKYFNGDMNEYLLDIDDGNFSWSSSMFTVPKGDFINLKYFV